MQMDSEIVELEFVAVLSERELAWIDLRERLARAARELHFDGFARQKQESAALLAIATSLAGLALSIPIPPARGLDGPVEASTLFAAQILQRQHAGTDEVITPR
jgi:hypothetical protein